MPLLINSTSNSICIGWPYDRSKRWICLNYCNREIFRRCEECIYVSWSGLNAQQSFGVHRMYFKWANFENTKLFPNQLTNASTINRLSFDLLAPVTKQSHKIVHFHAEQIKCSRINSETSLFNNKYNNRTKKKERKKEHRPIPHLQIYVLTSVKHGEIVFPILLLWCNFNRMSMTSNNNKLLMSFACLLAIQNSLMHNLTV